MPNFISTVNPEYGYVENKITFNQGENDDNSLIYILSRQEVGELDDNTIIAYLKQENNYTYYDCTVEQGIKYTYYITDQTELESGAAIVSTTPADNGAVEVDFEDIFLSDKDHSLRIRFNPKVSSFKTNFQEQKIDTLGGRFPFFVRNGNLKYREFPISGLISYEMDDYFNFGLSREIMDFRTETRDNRSFIPMTSARKFYTERAFKLAVYEWLTNGEPKIFRSSTEGNYVVRLMNVSLSPEDKLSRMIHSFSATAYEIADYTPENLRKYNIWPDGITETIITSAIATNTTYGIVKGSLLENQIQVLDDGTMAVNTINIEKLSTTGLDLVFSGGGAEIATNYSYGVVKGNATDPNAISITSEGEMEVNNISWNKIIVSEEDTLLLSAQGEEDK